MRLDPFRLPQAVSYASHDDFGEVSFTVDNRGVRMKRVLNKSGLPVTFALPTRAFRGVAARAIEDDLGDVTVTLELLHTDAMLCVPLLVAGDLDDVAADWRAWSEALGLPMLMVEADGLARPLEESIGSAVTVISLGLALIPLVFGSVKIGMRMVGLLYVSLSLAYINLILAKVGRIEKEEIIMLLLMFGAFISYAIS